MRKAANIVGITCAALATIAAVLKLVSLPGGSFLFVISTGIFCPVAVTLHLFYKFSLNKNKLKRAVDVAEWFAISMVLVALLYFEQSWPGVSSALYNAAFVIILWLVLFLLAKKRKDIVWEKLSVYHGTVVVMIIMLCIGWSKPKEKIEMADDALMRYDQVLASYEDLAHEVDSLHLIFEMDTLNASIEFDENEFRLHCTTLIMTIDNLKADLLGTLNQKDNVTAEEVYSKLLHPEEVDITTHYMVGEDPQFPNGKGAELYDLLLMYRERQLHPGISFSVPVKKDDEFRIQWVKDNFYHYPAVEVFIRLVMIQQSILQAEKDSITRKLFVKQNT